MKSGISLVDMAKEIQRQADLKADYMLDTRSLRLEPFDSKLYLNAYDQSGVPALEPLEVNSIAHRQIGTHLKIPAAYYDKMLEEYPQLLAQNVNAWFQREPSVRMIRTIEGTARAFLSNRYRRIDNLDIASIVLPVLQDMEGMHFESCQLTESRMESGSVAVKREPVELSALIERQLALDMPLLEQRNQRLAKDLTPGITVTGDASLLGRVAGNLLSNASLYSPEGAKVRVWCGLLNGRPALTVENTGVHISEDALPHLFEAFYREETSRNRATGGSGLGLYLVKMILDRHGAECSIKNTEDGVRAEIIFLANGPAPRD